MAKQLHFPWNAFEENGRHVNAFLRQHYLDQVQRVFRVRTRNSQPLAANHSPDGSPNTLLN